VSPSARLSWLALCGLCQCSTPLAQTPAPGVPRQAALRGLSNAPAPPAAPEATAESLDQIRRRLLEEQDTDCDQRITRDDRGSQRFRFRWQEQAYELSGGYVLSNLLEELALDLKSGESPRVARVMEDPIGRFSRVFSTTGWQALTRGVDEAGLPAVLEDPRLSPRAERTLYVPADDRPALDYFLGVAERYNGAHRRLARAVASLPLLGPLSDASVEERSQELVALLGTPEGRKNFAELRQRLAASARELAHPALSEHLAQTLARVEELVARAELPCVQSSAPRLSQLARRLARELAAFRPHALRVRPLAASHAENGPEALPASAPGALSLALRADASSGLSGVPFILPGGGAEQLNGWHSYFILLGLLQDGRLEPARDLVENLVYSVEHYQATLSANRSYYLGRSEPPYLGSMVRALWEATPAPERDPRWLQRALDAAVSEYRKLWTRSPRQLTSLCQGEGDGRVCLSRYPGNGSGQPAEAPPGSFEWLWQGLGRSLEASYVSGQLAQRDLSAELERAFRNERCMRESGHEATYRWFWPTQPGSSSGPAVNRCADMVSVDLNSLLYKSEVDIARLEAELSHDPKLWCTRAARRFALMKRHLWSARDGLFYDAFLAPTGPILTGYVSATSLYPLWATAEACEPNGSEPVTLSAQEKSALVTNALGQLEAPGGLLASARASRERFPARADRSWDYPNGWAPHQMLAWRALEAHGFHEDAQRLAFSWLYLLITQVIDYDGSTLDKYDVVERGHAADFNPASLPGDLAGGGFAWTNASFQVGLALLDPPRRARLAQAIASGRSPSSDSVADAHETGN
jgi:neutral trehalase